MKFILYRDAVNAWRWTLVAANGDKVADSAEGYQRKIDCRAGVKLVQKSADAEVVERS